MTHKMLINKFIKTGSSLLVQVLKIHRMSECELVQFQVSPVTRLIKRSEKGQSIIDLDWSIQFSLFDKQDKGFADYYDG